MKWETLNLTPTISIKIIDPPDLSSLLLNKIEMIWLNKKARFPNLFNGRIFTVSQISSTTVTGYWTEYKYLLAQIEDPELYTTLHIQSLAVNGLVRCPEGFIIGKRNPSSVYLPNYWQSPPAGSVESRQGESAVNLYQQLYTEAEEELGLQQQDLSKPLIVSATQHAGTHIIDVGILLETSLPFEVIQHRWRINANPEYNELTCLSAHATLPSMLLPTTRQLINAWHQHYSPKSSRPLTSSQY